MTQTDLSNQPSPNMIQIYRRLFNRIQSGWKTIVILVPFVWLHSGVIGLGLLEKGIENTLKTITSDIRIKGAKIILVDDASNDKTPSIIEKFDKLKIITHNINKGYGASIKTGVNKVTTSNVAWFDSDGQHSLDDLISMYSEFISHDYDAIFGRRTSASSIIPSRIIAKIVLVYD